MIEFFEIVLLFLFIICCIWCIIFGINSQMAKDLNYMKNTLADKEDELHKQILLNKHLLSLYQNEQDKTDTLWKIILHIRQELSLLKLKECPEEEFRNIPFEVIEWIDTLEKSSNGDENVIHK